MPEAVLEKVLDLPFLFERRPDPLPCDLRLEWRLHVLVLVLDQCFGGRATHQQLHVLDWAVRTEETRGAFLQFMKGERSPNQIIVRYDPSLNRAVDFAFAEGLAARTEEASTSEKQPRSENYRVLLTTKGRNLVKDIHEMADCFTIEKAFFAEIGRKVTQKHIESLFTWSKS